MISHHYNHIRKICKMTANKMSKTKKRFLFNMLCRPRQKSGPTHERIQSRLRLRCSVNQQSQQETKKRSQTIIRDLAEYPRGIGAEHSANLMNQQNLYAEEKHATSSLRHSESNGGAQNHKGGPRSCLMSSMFV